MANLTTRQSYRTRASHLRKKDGFNIRQASGIFLINSEAETKVLGESCWPADYSIYDIGPMDSGTNIYLTHKPLSTDFLGSLKKS